jgi:hypothetical protein
MRVDAFTSGGIDPHYLGVVSWAWRPGGGGPANPDDQSLVLIEVTSEEEWNWLVETGASFGLPEDRLGVPFMVIGDDVLMGSQQIPEFLKQDIAVCPLLAEPQYAGRLAGLQVIIIDAPAIG